MRLFVPLLALASLSAASAQAPANCALAARVDAASYAALTMTGASEADQDNVAFTWAQCRAAALNANLSNSPQLRARIVSLRGQYRELRDIESELAGIRAGGGTMYGHAVPRNYAVLEPRIESLANLARSSAGAVKSVEYEGALRDARDMQAAYIKTLRAYKPRPDETYVRYDAKDWNARVNRYEAVSKSIMRTLGNRGDAATALGYSILTDWAFGADE